MKTEKLPTTIKKLLAFRRRARFDYVMSKIESKNVMNAVDVGCGHDGRSFEDFSPGDWKIIGVDIIPNEQIRHNHPGFKYLKRDAQDLSCLGDGEFDLGVCIGMLEHITDEAIFRRIVNEIRRVAKQYIVIVPFKYCWIEPHYGFPFFPLFPYSMKLSIIRKFNLCHHREIVSKDKDYIARNFSWRTNKEYREAFQDAKIHLLPTLEMIAIIRKAFLGSA